LIGLELGRTLRFLNVVSRAEEVRRQFRKVVGLIHSRGVDGVMSIEAISHSKGLTI